MFLGFLLSLLRGEFKIFAPIPNNFALVGKLATQRVLALKGVDILL